VERLKEAANLTLKSTVPERWANAAAYLEAAARQWPDDAEAWSRLSAVLLEAERAEPGHDHLPAALRAARTARDRCPLIPGPHLRIGTFASAFAQCEVPAVHFARAKRVASFDPDVWYLSGAGALARGDRDAAWDDWRESLRRSPARLELVVRGATPHLTAEDLRTRVLPDDPAVWVAAAKFVDGETKAKWLRAATGLWASSHPERENGWIAWAEALEELGEPAEALEVWRDGNKRFPESVTLSDRLAARLEAEERYGEALPLLEWLSRQNPENGNFRDRLDAALHAQKLRREIGVP
jgi:tetratricopeptide (TPR) repeat protein